MRVLILRLGPLNTNCYILHGENDKKAAVIDPACCADVIQKRIERYGLVLDKILLTHAHFDHIMASQDLRKDGAKLYLHREDEELFHNSKLNGMYDLTGRDFKFDKADFLLEDGDVIELGDEKITVMHTPGHTKGSVCYITGKDIFTGDTLFSMNVGRTDLYGGDYDTLRRSLKKIAALKKNYSIFPGHGGTTTLEEEKEYNVYLNGMR